MDFTLSKRGLLLGALLLSLLTFWWLKSATDAVSSHIVWSVTDLQTPAEIIQQITEENASTSSNGSNNKPSLKDEIEAAKSRLSKSDYKAAKSQYKKMVEHIEKLENYKQNPLKFDNQGLLQNTTSQQLREKIIQGRIKHLETEIQAFYNNIVKILN